MSIADKTMKPVQDVATPSAEEAEERRNLAACYGLVARFGWDDLLASLCQGAVRRLSF